MVIPPTSQKTAFSINETRSFAEKGACISDVLAMNMTTNLDQHRRDLAKDKLRSKRAYERAIASGKGAVEAACIAIPAGIPSAAEMSKREVRWLMRMPLDHPEWLKYGRVIDPTADVDRNIAMLTEAIVIEHIGCAVDHQTWCHRGGVQRLRLARNALMILRWARRYDHVAAQMQAAE